MRKIAEIKVRVYCCDLCPNLIRGRARDCCDAADKDIPEVFGRRMIPEWCPCLVEEASNE